MSKKKSAKKMTVSKGVKKKDLDERDLNILNSLKDLERYLDEE